MPVVAVTIRPAEERDYPAIVELWARAEPDDQGVTVDVFRWILGRAVPDRPHPHLVAEDDGRVVGWTLMRGLPGVDPAYLFLDVDPAHRRQGVGTALFESVLAAAAEETEVTVTVSEGIAGAEAFALHHGFEEVERYYESAVDLATFDAGRFADAEADLGAAGYRFSSLAREDSPDLRESLHRLFEAVRADAPTVEAFHPLSFADWTRTFIEVPHARPTCFALAFWGTDPVALSMVASQSEGEGYLTLTGVAREHREKGLGLAVKVRALRAAQELGLRQVVTNNNPANGPMLAINRTLGFVNRPGRITMTRKLTSSAS